MFTIVYHIISNPESMHDRPRRTDRQMEDIMEHHGNSATIRSNAKSS